MIVSKDMNPERELYYLGALVIDVLQGVAEEKADFFDVFQRLNAKSNVSMSLFTLTLDWLFILGVISLENGNLKKCF